MILIFTLSGLVILAAIVLFIVQFLDRQKLKNREYKELTLFLGSGGHTGQLCQMLEKFQIDKISKINIIITSTDKTSQIFFKRTIEKYHPKQMNEIMGKTHFFLISRTNEVKQSLITSVFSTLRSILHTVLVVRKNLINTTHLLANGPGTCVPLFFVFFFINKIRLTRVRLTFVESWCRVYDLSLTGKLLRPIVNDFIVHWPQLAVKYKNCKYFGKII